VDDALAVLVDFFFGEEDVWEEDFGAVAVADAPPKLSTLTSSNHASPGVGFVSALTPGPSDPIEIVLSTAGLASVTVFPKIPST
jgi:hypothetical protein